MLKGFLRSALIVAAAVVGTQAMATTYTLDGAHSSINFQIKHMLSRVNGRFTDFNGTFNFDPDMKNVGDFKTTIKAASINTDQTKRDEHLRSPDFFNVAKFPEITFNGKKATKTGKNTFKVTGDLTMVGKTKPVTIDFEYTGEAKDPMGNMKAGFIGKTKINRKDFGINWNKALDKGGYLLGDDVTVEILIEADAAKAKSAMNK